MSTLCCKQPKINNYTYTYKGQHLSILLKNVDVKAQLLKGYEFLYSVFVYSGNGYRFRGLVSVHKEDVHEEAQHLFIFGKGMNVDNQACSSSSKCHKCKGLVHGTGCVII